MTDTDLHSQLYRLVPKDGTKRFLSIEELADPLQYTPTPTDDFGSIRPGDWYDWFGERKLLVCDTGNLEHDYWTINKAREHKNDVYVFEVEQTGIDTIDFVKNFEYLRNYKPSVLSSTSSDQMSIKLRKVEHPSEIVNNSIFLLNGIYYQRDGQHGKRIDTNVSIRLAGLDSRIFHNMNQLLVDQPYQGGPARSFQNYKRRLVVSGVAAGITVGGAIVGILMVNRNTQAPLVPLDPVIMEVGATPNTLQNCLTREHDLTKIIQNKDALIDSLRDDKSKQYISKEKVETAMARCTTDLGRNRSELKGVKTELETCQETLKITSQNALSVEKGAHEEKLAVEGDFLKCTTQLKSLDNQVNTLSNQGGTLSNQINTLNNQVRTLTSQLQSCNKVPVVPIVASIAAAPIVSSNCSVDKKQIEKLEEERDDLIRELSDSRETEENGALLRDTCESERTALLAASNRLGAPNSNDDNNNKYQNCSEKMLEIQTALATAQTDQLLVSSPKARYELITKKLQDGHSQRDEQEVANLVTSWIKNTCGQKDPRCPSVDRFEVQGNSFSDAAQKLYASVVGDTTWKIGENDKNLARRYVTVAAIHGMVHDGRTIDETIVGTYGFK